MKIVFVFFFLCQSFCYSQDTRALEIFFPKSSTVLSEGAKDSLNEFLESFSPYKILSVNINGYSDEERIRLFNITLSERRARSVYDFIENSKKVRTEIISYKGHGKASSKNKQNTELIVTYVSRDSVVNKEKKKKLSF